MAPNEFLNQMQMIYDRCKYDKEAMHYSMDKLMCIVLRELGYEKGVELFKDAPKWYS